ncbi:DUF3794 domain-containing protein [Alicyclobacillus fastidiosus]|uniref:DUF3794 domain-containing protein n=1 Tax=Alicyclobacillus fastidiosus TaxID=392011 RepID=A0ABY6ZLV1_9BACL|nr:DUF3794 domain-containing protein [Alicyclobacillus fastidiosus]WAH43831.1 DUF3794 domain-containing protein [Alicyclobacillus fastidiosus]GMA60062.1 hypothetical protein GCM10025859_05020 [Alicyclobacillus fastidiosus]
MGNPFGNFVDPLATSTSAVPTPAPGTVITKVPIALAEVTVQVNTEFPITFPTPVLEIKTIKKNLKITQALLALPSSKLFLSGFVRKNIQYATTSSLTTSGLSSTIQSLTVDVPWSVVTDLAGQFLAPPVMPRTNTSSQFGFQTTSTLPSPPFTSTKEMLIANDLAEFDQVNTEFFNELPFIELVSATFTEFDLAIGRTPFPTISPTTTPSPFEEGLATQYLEKMVIDITVKVLQKQQIVVTAVPAPTPVPAAGI